MIAITLTENHWNQLRIIMEEKHYSFGDYQRRPHLEIWKEYFKERGATYHEQARASSAYYWGKVSFRTEKQQMFFIMANPELCFLFDKHFKMEY